MAASLRDWLGDVEERLFKDRLFVELFRGLLPCLLNVYVRLKLIEQHVHLELFVSMISLPKFGCGVVLTGPLTLLLSEAYDV